MIFGYLLLYYYLHILKLNKLQIIFFNRNLFDYFLMSIFRFLFILGNLHNFIHFALIIFLIWSKKKKSLFKS